MHREAGAAADRWRAWPACCRADRGSDEFDARSRRNRLRPAPSRNGENRLIPFVDLKAQYLAIKDEVDTAIRGVLETCQFTLGSEVVAFEQEFASFQQTAHGIGVNTGTSALHLSLLAAGIGPGDEVITVPFTFMATVSAIDYTGARAGFVDIAPRTFAMDPMVIESAITDRTRAIIPVHLYGQPADMDPIMEVARRHGLVVIE